MANTLLSSTLVMGLLWRKQTTHDVTSTTKYRAAKAAMAPKVAATYSSFVNLGAKLERRFHL